MKFLSVLIEPLLNLIGKAAALLFMHNAGKKSERLKNAEGVIENVDKANKAGRAADKPDNIVKLRRKYTRK